MKSFMHVMNSSFAPNNKPFDAFYNEKVSERYIKTIVSILLTCKTLAKRTRLRFARGEGATSGGINLEDSGVAIAGEKNLKKYTKFQQMKF